MAEERFDSRSYRDSKKDRRSISYRDYRTQERARAEQWKKEQERIKEAREQALEIARAKDLKEKTAREDALNKQAFEMKDRTADNQRSDIKLGDDERNHQDDYFFKSAQTLYDQNKDMATSVDERGDKILDSKKLAELNGPLDKLLLGRFSQQGSSQQGGNQSNPVGFIDMPDDMESKIREDFKKRKTTNSWGDDLTKDAPQATTTYKDGERTWDYPGVADPKTGEVRNALKITAPYGSEEEYQNKGGVVGQNPDGSWIWDKNVKSGSGGGFFQRGGISDLGKALAGDNPRTVPRQENLNIRDTKTPESQPLLNERKFLERMAMSGNGAQSTEDTDIKKRGDAGTNLNRVSFRVNPAVKDVVNNVVGNTAQNGREFLSLIDRGKSRSAQVAALGNAQPMGESNPVDPTIDLIRNTTSNSDFNKFPKIRTALNEKYNPDKRRFSGLDSYINSLRGNR